MTRVPVLLTLALLAAPALAGCIQVPSDPDAQDFDQAPVDTTGGSMTAREEKKEDSGVCTDGGTAAGFCATRVVTVEGTISGISLLEVDLATVNGGITVRPSDGNEWTLVATLKASGSSVDDAKRRLETIVFTWSHQVGDSHFLDAEATMEGRNENYQRSASIEVTMPRAVALRLTAGTTNGGVTVKDVRTDGLHAGTTNGGIDVDASVTQVDLGTTNGGIDAKLKPTGSGRIHLGTTNGRIELSLPEDAERGYDLDASTTNGDVSITLRDGEVGPCPEGSEYYTPPCNHRTFKTTDYGSRAIRSSVQLGTTNGGIDVGPA